MAERRMFAKSIIDSDLFLDMPQSTQNLYFHLSLRADDDGFVGNPKKIMRMIGCSQDDIKILISKQFLIPFESGVVVIRHWKIHNYIRNDRYKPTIYTEEKKKLTEKDNKEYIVGIPSGNQTDTQYSIGKSSQGEDREEEESISKEQLENEFEKLWSMYPNKKGKKKALDHYIKCRKRKDNPVSYEKVEKGISNYNFFIQKNKVQLQYIKHGSTWFNQECWNDDYTVIKQDEEKSILDMLKEIGEQDDLLGGIDYD